jgi:ribosomal protein S6--L-glutamate ligase
MSVKVKKPKALIGWEEWCSLPDLGLPAVKAKIDTGARTSALHAYDIETFILDKTDMVRFKIHPLQRNNDLERQCMARLVGKRNITSSNGERENRFVIHTRIEFPTKVIETEITLTTRHTMAFRMLLGRTALRKARFAVDPGKRFLLGKREDVEELY